MTTGMSAAPMGMTKSNPKTKAKPTMRKKAVLAEG